MPVLLYTTESTAFFFLGGSSKISDQLNMVVQYNVNTYQSKIVGRFAWGMDSIVAAITGKRDIFTFGGYEGDMYRAREIYKLSGHNPTPEVVNNLIIGANMISAVAVGSTSIFISGGMGASNDFDRRQISPYDVTANTLELVGRLPKDLWSHAPVYDGENIFVFGGNYFNSAI